MSRLAIAAAILMASATSRAAEPIALRDMGSFHVGGRLVEISGKPVKEVTFTPGGVLIQTWLEGKGLAKK
ncbi:hypothetical protein [Bradyrhizobium sp. UFLA03-84]|uniref:hypothetical protein n=1 Tax=Bradyrhizobium sp. UFLA03-84 TaxID=418599 RepID=UPI001FD91A0F|nr:hypothetical protein [Bradyrhizobium sp. UFLA03-84]